MHKSKLETYEDILETLLNGPLRIADLGSGASSSSGLVKRHIEFLMRNQLIEERKQKRQKLYAITERGVAVLRALNFQKYLGKIKSKVRAIDEAMEIIPEISENDSDSHSGRS